MRVCKSCSENYEDYGQKASLCRPCKRAYDRHYHANRPSEKKVRKQKLQVDRINQNKMRLLRYLEDKSCEHCGEDDPIVLDFDHIDQSTKHKNVVEMYDYAWDRIQEEINKCRILCANCHRKHTAVQLGWYSYRNHSE